MKILFIKFKFIKNSLKGLKTAVFLDQKAPGGGVNPYGQPDRKLSGGFYDFPKARCDAPIAQGEKAYQWLFPHMCGKWQTFANI